MREEGVEHELIELATSYAELEGEAEEVRRRYQELYAEYKAETDAEKLKVIEAGGLCILGTERTNPAVSTNPVARPFGQTGRPPAYPYFSSLWKTI